LCRYRRSSGQVSGPIQERLAAQAACDGAGLAEGVPGGFGVQTGEVLGVVEQAVGEVAGGARLAQVADRRGK